MYLSRYGCPTLVSCLAGLFGLYRSDSLVLPVPFWSSCSACHVLTVFWPSLSWCSFLAFMSAVLLWQFGLGSFVLTTLSSRSSPGNPVQIVHSGVVPPGYPLLAVRFWQSCSSCQLLPVLFFLSRYSCPVILDPSCLSGHAWPILAVLSCLYFPELSVYERARTSTRVHA